MDKINIGIIGLGYWGKKILKEYADLAKGGEGVNVRSVCDLDEENLRYCVEHFGITDSYRDYRELLDNSEIDAVNICTPNETHYRICSEALNSNKHALLEKPMTLKASEAYELAKSAKKKGLNLSVGHIFRFNNALQKVRNFIMEGTLGDLYYIDLDWTAMLNTPNRDIITDLAPHPFDILNFLTDKWPIMLTCTANGYRNSNRDLAFISAEFDGKVIGHMHLSWLVPKKARLIKLCASKGTVDVDCLSQDVNVTDGQKTYALEVERNNTIKSELLHFLECIRNNSSGKEYINHVNGVLGAHVVILLEATIKSIEQYRTVEVDNFEGQS
jgi:predicted dehydrogenase